MFFDGMVPNLQKMMFEEIPVAYRPTYCLYGKSNYLLTNEKRTSDKICISTTTKNNIIIKLQ